MAEIRIEAKTTPVGLGTGHLYLVFVNDLGSEFVIRGGPAYDSPPFGAIDVDVGILLANSEDARPLEDRSLHGSQVLDLGERDAIDVWNSMLLIASLIDANAIDYDSPFQNSNSVIASVLDAVGIDPNLVAPYPSGVSYYPGGSNLLLDEFERAFEVEHTSDNNDILNGGDLNDSFDLGGGDDLIQARSGDDTLNGGEGNDILFGGNDSDTLLGGIGDDELYGEDKKDTLVGGAGDDLLDGGNGIDTADYSAAANIGASARTAGIQLVSSDTAVTVDDGLGGVDTLIGIEVLEGTLFDDVFAFEGNLSEALSNLSNIYGGLGGTTGDVLDFSGITSTGNGFSGVYVTFGDHEFTIVNDIPDYIDGVRVDDVWNVIGTSFEDTITGDDQANMLDGGAGEDILDGGLGQDIIFGGRDDDQIAGFVWSELGAPNPDMGDPLEGQVYAFDPGSLSSVIDGGEGIDILTYEDEAKARVGVFSEELAYVANIPAKRENGLTRLRVFANFITTHQAI